MSYNIVSGATVNHFQHVRNSSFGFFIDPSMNQACGFDMQYPFFVNGKYLWHSTPALRVVDLEDIKHPPLAILVRPDAGPMLSYVTSKILPCAEPNEVIWLNARYVVKVRYQAK